MNFDKRRRISTVVLAIAGIISIGLATPVTAAAQVAQSASSAAATTGAKIAILPTANLSGEKDARQRTDQAAKADEELTKQFSEHGFDIIPRATIDKALADAKIDLTDEEFQNRATLYKVAKAVGADLVAFVVITDVDQRRVRAPFTGEEMVGKAKTKMWVLKVADETPLVNAVRHESQAKSNLAPGFDSGARLIRNSVAGAVRDTLKPFWPTYPVTKK